MERAPIKPVVGMEVLDSLDIRVGTISAVSDVPKSKKLVKLTVDFGDHERQVLVGMKGEHDDTAELRGRQALFVVNLAPKHMAGDVSEAMLLDVGYADGIRPVLAVPEQPVPAGARAG